MIYSPFYNINKYIDTYVIHNCISSLHTGLTIKELYIASDGGKIKQIYYSNCLRHDNLICVL